VLLNDNSNPAQKSGKWLDRAMQREWCNEKKLKVSRAKQNAPDSILSPGRLLISPPPSAAQ
jgi:hypothetical protein